MRLPWLRVAPAAGTEPLPWGCGELLARQERGEDPTAPWREDFARATARQYGEVPPPHVGAAFVLLWYLDVLAYPLTYAAALGPWVLDVSPEAVRFDLHPQLYPCAVSLGGDDPVAVGDAGQRTLLARSRYLAHAERFAASYRPGVKMSSRQRFGAVRDTWTIAMREAAVACSPAPHPEPVWREACCFIVSLPGAKACLTCPRRRPSPAQTAAGCDPSGAAPTAFA